MRTEHFLNAVLGIENVQLRDAMDTCKEKTVSIQLTATHIYTVILLVRHVLLLKQPKMSVLLLINVIWPMFVSSNLTQLLREDAKNISHQLLVLVCEFQIQLISLIAVYAKQQSDLFVCADGFGYLDSKLKKFTLNFSLYIGSY